MGQTISLIAKAQIALNEAVEGVQSIDTGEPRSLWAAQTSLRDAMQHIEQFAMAQYSMEPDDLKSYRGVKK